MTQEPKKEYSIEERIKEHTIEKHRHIFACWAASRAASVRPSKNSTLIKSTLIKSFTVKQGLEVLEKIGFTKDFKLENLLKLQGEFDNEHTTWCNKVIEEFKKEYSKDKFSYGVAAKLINCYLKVRFVCGSDHKVEGVNFMHPPIDSLLLESLVKDSPDFRKSYKELKNKAWSNFDKEDYKKVIEEIKKISGDEPLWKIEYDWQGYR